jgi:peptidoglycan-N-acetylglucosamine deacetylase
MTWLFTHRRHAVKLADVHPGDLVEVNQRGGLMYRRIVEVRDRVQQWVCVVRAKLERLHAPATFFEIGFMFRWFGASAGRELHMGDVIGDHTETHPPMALLPPSAQHARIVDQTEWVRKYGGPFPRLWRPPYGSYNATTLHILHRLRMLMVLWTVDTDDYRRPGVATIVHRAIAGARPGAIILMHDAGGDRTQTIAALPLIVHTLRAHGYRLLTIPQLILDDPPGHRQQLPGRLAGD